MERLIIIGAGGHGKVVADIAKKMCKYESIAFLDDTVTSDCIGVPVIGNLSDVKNYISDSDVFVAIGNTQTRRKIINELLGLNAHIATLVHPQAVIGSDVDIGVGTVIMAGAVINPCVAIGKGTIINTCSSVDHDCRIGDFTHISVGAHVAGGVIVGEQTFIGAGATIRDGVSILEKCVIGAGATVVKDITKPGVYIGVPAKIRE